MMYPAKENDFYGWAFSNASLLKEGKYEQADIKSIVEELEDMGISNEHQLINRLGILLAHLIKWQLQPDFRGRSWSGTIKEQRNKIERLIRKNPSLKSKIKEAMKEGFDDAKTLIEKETPIDLKAIPDTCPFSFEEAMKEDFYPTT